MLSRAVPFDTDTALQPAGPGAWEGAIAPGWAVLRGPLGGYVAAILLRGLTEAVAAPERQLRSLTVHFLRPAEVGPVRVEATVERAGRSLSTATGRLLQDDRAVAFAVAAFSSPWPGPRYDDLPMPPVDPPGPRVAPTGAAAFVPPEFAEQLTMQPRIGALPFTGAQRAEVGGWLGLLEDRPLDALAIVLLADAWFPAPFARLTTPAPAPTIDLTVHVRASLPRTDPSELVLGRFTSGLARDGFFDEDGALWAPDGTLLAQSRQLALLLGA